ncbi:integrase [Gossypium australe]|uniref:Integrase n=1 Tax=Gossypium australe TaxID=47621 RepID=A0A5B6WTD9_9ROSI|nr:integrase [Gossypium australe]
MIATLMTRLLQKDSFEKLKALLAKAPVLVQPESNKEFVIFNDASLNVLGCVFMQEGKVIAYASKQLKLHEKNYPTQDLELVAIVFALRIWRHHLFGEKCHIFTDHKSLKWLKLLKGYELVIDYHSGKANVVTDALSRKSLFALRAMNMQLTMSDDCLILAELKAKQLFLQQICKAQKCDNELQAKRVQICVSRNSELIQKILHEEHSGCLSIHPWSTKMYNDFKQLYWWSGMKQDISEFVTRCLVCQQVKSEHQVPSGLLQPMMIPEWK